MSEQSTKRENETREDRRLTVTIISFGYKEGDPPLANCLFDLRFLKNPFWVPELRPLTGLDQSVQEYVLTQPAAIEFLENLTAMMGGVLPHLLELDIQEFTIAFGCTGGQHRSCAMAEALAQKLTQSFPEYNIQRAHRELERILSRANSSVTPDQALSKG